MPATPRLTGARVRTLVDHAGSAKIADTADTAEASALLARLETAGAVERREGAARCASTAMRTRSASNARRAALSPRLHAEVEGRSREGLADSPSPTRDARGEPASTLASARAARSWRRRARRGDRRLPHPRSGLTYAVLLPASPPPMPPIPCPAYAPATLVLEAAPDDPLAILAGSGSWLADLGRRLARDHGGRAPSTQAWTAEQHRFVGRLCAPSRRRIGLTRRRPSRHGRPSQGREAGPRGGRVRRTRGALGPCFARRQEERNTGVAVELLAAKVLAYVAYPLLPDWSARLWRCLGYSSSLGEAIDGVDGKALWERDPGLGAVRPADRRSRRVGARSGRR